VSKNQHANLPFGRLRSGLAHADVRSIMAEVRLVDGEAGGKPTIRGYGATYNTRSQVMEDECGNQFVETIVPGAFARSLAEADQRAFFNHDANSILGRLRSIRRTRPMRATCVRRSCAAT
jgi:phage head maturation protease